MCKNYNNPVYRTTVSGFTLLIQDHESINNDIMTFPTWSLDATTLQSITLKTNVNFNFYLDRSSTPSPQVPIQTECGVGLDFEMPVPVEKSSCYLKIKYPNDFPLEAKDYIYQGYNMMSASIQVNGKEDNNLFN